MAKLPQAVASRIVADGATKKLPGFETGAYALDQAPIIMHSGLLDAVDAVTEQTPQYFPFAAKVVSIKIRVRTQLGTGAALIRVGKVGDPDWFSETSIAIALTAGTVTTATILNAGVIAAGDVLYFSADGGATTTGDVDVTVIAVPV